MQRIHPVFLASPGGCLGTILTWTYPEHMSPVPFGDSCHSTPAHPATPWSHFKETLEPPGSSIYRALSSAGCAWVPVTEPTSHDQLCWESPSLHFLLTPAWQDGDRCLPRDPRPREQNLGKKTPSRARDCLGSAWRWPQLVPGQWADGPSLGIGDLRGLKHMSVRSHCHCAGS